MVFWGQGPAVSKMSLAPEQPQGCSLCIKFTKVFSLESYRKKGNFKTIFCRRAVNKSNPGTLRSAASEGLQDREKILHIKLLHCQQNSFKKKL